MLSPPFMFSVVVADLLSSQFACADVNPIMTRCRNRASARQCPGSPGIALTLHRYSGGYCGGVPPLPIPNREVKPACADGTAMQCGRVGGRHFSWQKPCYHMIAGLLCIGNFCVISSLPILLRKFLQSACEA